MFAGDDDDGVEMEVQRAPVYVDLCTITRITVSTYARRFRSIHAGVAHKCMPHGKNLLRSWHASDTAVVVAVGRGL